VHLSVAEADASPWPNPGAGAGFRASRLAV